MTPPLIVPAEAKPAKPRAISVTAFEVDAILAGRCSQLRRVVKPQPTENESVLLIASKWNAGRMRDSENAWREVSCPFGAPGDTIYLKHKTVVRIERVVVSVRVERVNKITEADVWASGLRRGIYSHSKKSFIECDDGTDAETPDGRVFPPIAAFHTYWNELHCLPESCTGDECFEAGPWVWVCTVRAPEGKK